MRTLARLAAIVLAGMAGMAHAQSQPGVGYNPPKPPPGVGYNPPQGQPGVGYAPAPQPKPVPAQPSAAARVVAVSDRNADQVLKPGDILIKMLNTKSEATTWGTAVTQGAIQEFMGAFSAAARSGNPATVHAAIYVGNHQTAEAHRSSDEDKEGTSLRDIEHHAGYLFYVFRPRNAQLGVDAAAVARRWANWRMGYRIPWETPFHNSDYGPKAVAEAISYGAAANTAGGPPGEKQMFCSQFVLAVYQAAVVHSAVTHNPNLKANQIGMYPGVDRQASYTSPLVMHGHLQSSQGFAELPMIVVQKSH